MPGTDDPRAARAPEDERYRLLAENADDFVAFIGTDDRIQWVNPGVTTVLGWAPDDLLGRPITDAVHPDDHAALKAQHRAARESRRPTAGAAPELRVRTKDGGHRWMSVRVVTLYGEDEARLGGIAAFRDAEEAVAAREALRTSQARYAELADSIPVGLYITRGHPDGRFDLEFASGAAARILDFDVPAAMADGSIIGSKVHPDDLPSLVAANIASFHARRSFRWEGRFLVRGESRIVRLASEPEGDPDDPGGIHWRGIIEDVTDQRRAEEALRASEARYAEMADRLPVGLFTIRLDGAGGFAFDYMSPQAGRMTGVDPSAVLRDARAAFAGAHPDDVHSLIGSSMAAARDRIAYAWEGRFLIDGATRWIRIESDPDPRSGDEVVFHGFIEDVTERHQAAEALEARQADLEEAQRIGKTGSFGWDAATDSATWSAELIDLYGFDPDAPPSRMAAIGRHLPPEAAAAIQAAVGRLMETGEPFELEHEYVRADGTIGWVLSRCQPRRDLDGAVTGVRGTQTDITDRRRAEMAVRESEELYRSIVAISPDTIAVTSLDGTLEFFSPSGVGLFGLTDPGDALGHRLIEWIHPDDRGRAAASLQARAQGGAIGPAVFRAVRADGSTFDIEVNGRLRRDAAGAPTGFVFVVRDITERRLIEEALRVSEERHRLIAENALDVLWTMAPDGRITYVSPSVETLRGFTVDEALAQSIDEILTPASATESVAALSAIITEAASGREPAPYRGEQEYRCKDGSTLWCDVMARAVLAPDGSLVEVLGVSRDISARKRSEAELIAARDAAEAASAALLAANTRLSAAEARYRELVDRIPVGVYVYRNRADGAFAFDYFSPQAVRLTGIDAEAAIEDPAAGIAPIHPDDLPEMFALSEATRAANAHFRWEGRFTVDGAARIIRIDADPTPGEDGWTRWHGIVADVTEARQAEEAARASEALTSAVVQGTADVVYVKDPDGKMLLINDPAARLLGRRAGDFVGLDERAWFPPDLADAIIATDLRVLATGEAVTVEEEVVDASGGRHTFLSSKSRLRAADGTTIGLLAVGRDISERKAMEEVLRAQQAELTEAQHLAHMGSWTRSTDGVGTWSEEMFRMHGLDPRGGAPSFDEYARYTSPADFARMRSATEHCLQDGTAYELEHEIRLPDGVVRYVRTRASAMRDADGRVVGVRGTQQDISAEHELEARLRQAQRLEAVGQLAGGIAHDFNNLLAAIRGYTELAREALPADDPVAADLEEALRTADRAAGLTRQLLAFSRRQPLHPEVIDPADTVDALAPMLRRLLGEHIELTTACGADLGNVRVDPSRLEQVIVNLAVNARDAMPEGGRLSISLENAISDRLGEGEEAGGPRGGAGHRRPCVRLTVADTGTGIDPAIMPRIFEPFFTTKDVGDGSGMGLATVYGIVGASGGTVTVASEVGRGTTFTIDLPLVEGPAAAALPDGRQDDAGSVVGGPETIILVEDEPSVRGITARMLRGFGYTVIDVGGPAEALALGDDVLRSADLLVTDVVMPGMSGPRLADLLRERVGRPIATVFASGYAPDPTLAQRLEEPGTAFVSKPFDSPTLAMTVRQALEGR